MTTSETSSPLPRVAAASPTSAPHRWAYVALAALRILIGWVFLWAFLDKVFGFGYATPSGKSWLDGGSPTKGFLSGSQGPLSGFYHSLAGTTFADISFMAALLLIGVALVLGITNRLVTFGATALYLMMWSVYLPPVTNPIVDDHVIQAVAVLVLGAFHAGEHYGLGRWWNGLPFVQNLPILK